MINIEATIRWKGYNPNDLKPKSRKRVWANCDICGKGRWIPIQSYRDLCSSCVKIGQKHSEEHIRNFVKSATGKNNSFFGKHRTKENIAKISGKNSVHYNPNITDEERQDNRKYPEYMKWRKDIYERDNYTCQICNNKGFLNAHHLESYINNKELRITLSNGITLCENCHKNFHYQYGKGNNTSEQFKEFAENLK